jgi:hypothetical protein
MTRTQAVMDDLIRDCQAQPSRNQLRDRFKAAIDACREQEAALLELRLYLL